MHRYTRAAVVFCLSVTLFSACNRIPDHMRYIPKDAVLVTGINLKSLGKKIAWNMITGSKLFKEMQKRIPQKNGNAEDAMSNIDKAGIDVMNTFYVYLKSSKTSAGSTKIIATALVPLNDAGLWEAYLKKSFTQADVKQRGEIKIASMGNNMYAGWNKNTLIILSLISNTPDYNNPDPQPVATPDMAAEMDTAFAVAHGNTIKDVANFHKLQAEGHDLTLWINYDQIMNQYMSENMASKMGGLSLNSSMWKNAAFACGFDFTKGKITGDMTYYTPSEMSEVYKEFGAVNTDKDMLARLPKADMDMMVSMHLSPKGIKTMLDKMGYLGLANAGLATQNLNVDNVLDAFTGDMAFTVNRLSIQPDPTPNEFGIKTSKTEMSMSYVLKINKKENFMKLFDIARQAGLVATTNGYYMQVGVHDSVFVLLNDQYAVASNKYADANAILQGTNKGQKLPANIEGHPFAMLLDIQQSVKNMDLSSTLSFSDSLMFGESKKLLSGVSINGGEFKDNAMTSHMELNFTNTEENSIIALLDFGMRLNDASMKKQMSAGVQ